MASCQTSQWVNTAPYVKLTVTETSATANTATLSWTLQYIASSAANTSVNKEYSVKIAGAVVKSGTFNIDGKTGTHTIASGIKAIEKGVSSESIAFSVTFAFNLTWSGVYKGELSASNSISVAARSTYVVGFDANGGSGAPAAQDKVHGVTLTLSPVQPTRNGYTFLGWSTTKGGSVAYAPGASYTKNEAVLLFAVWRAWSYNVHFDANGGSGAPGDQLKTHGQALTLSTITPTRDGYTFIGWGTSESSTTVAYKPGAAYTANAGIYLYAIWSTAYIKPRISNIAVFRCRQDTNVMTKYKPIQDEAGPDVAVLFDWECDISHPDTDVLCKRSDVRGWETTEHLFDYTSGIYDAITFKKGYDCAIFANLSDAHSYSIRIKVSDTGGETVILRNLPSAKMAFQAIPPDDTGEYGFSIGKRAELNGVCDIGLQTYMRNGIKHPVLEPNTDLNDVRTPNTYIGENVSNYAYANCPIPAGTFTLQVCGAGEDGQCFQVLTRCSKEDPVSYMRYFYQGAWGIWKSNVQPVIYQQSTTEDLNNYKQSGTWFFHYTKTPTNCPPGNVAGWLIVLRANSGAIRQIWLRDGAIGLHDAHVYMRTINESGNYGTWLDISVAPFELYNNATGSAGTIALSSSIPLANLKYIEVFYTDNNSLEQCSRRIYSPNEKRICLSMIEASSATTTYIRRTAYTCTNGTLIPNTETSGFVKISGTAVSHTSGSNYIKITRVLGYLN